MLCDGSEISRITYAKLFNIIGTTFGEGDGLNTFNIPDFRDRFIQGANENVGTVFEAGLPNITFNLWNDYRGYFQSANGALAVAGPLRPDWTGTGSVVFSHGLTFNASRSSSVYGKSPTVQPPAIALNIFIKY